MRESTSEYVLIPVGNGKFAKVDQEDADMARRKWRLINGGREDLVYASRFAGFKSGERKSVMMHVEIAKRAGVYVHGISVNHINGDSLDNRRGNLRAATPHDYQGTRRRSRNNTSGFKGVCPGRHGKWRAVIRYLGKQKKLGEFSNIIDAAIAYDRAALAAFGEFACTNYPAFAVGHASHGNKNSQRLARIAAIRTAALKTKQEAKGGEAGSIPAALAKEMAHAHLDKTRRSNRCAPGRAGVEGEEHNRRDVPMGRRPGASFGQR